MLDRATASVRFLSGEREPVRVATTGNIELDGLQTIDGVELAVNDRVLVKDQTDARLNGIYTASQGLWHRASDARFTRAINAGVTVQVVEGTVHGEQAWRFTSINPSIGTDDITLGFYISADFSDDILSDVNAAIAAGVAAAEAEADRAEAAASAFPPDGEAGQFLAKASGASFDTVWVNPPSTGIALATSLAGLAALDVTTNATAFLSMDWRAGFWRLRTVASLSAAELAARTADALGGIFINSTDDVAYVWHRIYSGAINVQWFDVPGDLSITKVETYDRLDVCWYVAIELGHDIYHPAGVYDCGEANFPYRQKTAPVALMDAKNITIFGDGPSTVLQTDSTYGADVLQLYGMKNMKFRDFAIKSFLSGLDDPIAGSNGISIVGGWDNLDFDNLTIGPLAYVDRTTYIDGGKALSFQSEAATLECGRARARYTAKFCSQGFGFESNITNMIGKNVSVDVEVMAERCFVAVVHGAPAASGAVVENLHSGIRVKAHSVNCQNGLFLARTHGIDVDITFTSTEGASTKATSHTGDFWNASDIVNNGVKLAYAKDSNIRASGNVGACAYMAAIGSASAGSSTLTTATNNCSINMRNLRATPSVSIMVDLTASGTALTASELVISGSAWSSAAVPASFLTPTGDLKNNCYVGTVLLT